MKIGIYSHAFGKNKIFEKNPIGENLEYPMVYLRDTLKGIGVELCTLDMHPMEEFDIVFFTEIPQDKGLVRHLKEKGIRVFLQITESEIVDKRNWNKQDHEGFEKIFVWNDAWVDNRTYFKFYLPNKFPEKIEFEKCEKEKLCTLIASNRYERDSRELYTKRIEAIEWFEKEHPEDFELFGFGWDVYKFKGKWTRIFNRITPVKRLLAPPYKTYKGTIASKNEVLKKFRFSICYENARNIPGYITEKIFDCFFAGCVPVYWGAPNVKDFIWENTFIAKESFPNYEELYDYLIHMDSDLYFQYLDNIRAFLYSEEGKRFSAQYYARNFIKEILGEDIGG